MYGETLVRDTSFLHHLGITGTEIKEYFLQNLSRATWRAAQEAAAAEGSKNAYMALQGL